MTTIDDQQVTRLLEDIASIKSIINDNKPLMKQLLLPAHFRMVTFIAGLAVIGVSAYYFLLIEQYGGYSSVPEKIKDVSLAAMFCLFLLITILKRVLWIRSVKKADQQMTFGLMIRNLYQAQIFHVWIPILIVALVLSVYFIYHEIPHFIVPLTAATFGIIYNMIGGITRIFQYLVLGYWMFVSSILPLLFPSVSIFIFLALSHGCGMLMFVATTGHKE